MHVLWLWNRLGLLPCPVCSRPGERGLPSPANHKTAVVAKLLDETLEVSHALKAPLPISSSCLEYLLYIHVIDYSILVIVIISTLGIMSGF